MSEFSWVWRVKSVKFREENSDDIEEEAEIHLRLETTAAATIKPQS